MELFEVGDTKIESKSLKYGKYVYSLIKLGLITVIIKKYIHLAGLF